MNEMSKNQLDISASDKNKENLSVFRVAPDPNDLSVIYRPEFPIYQIRAFTNEVILIAGGGGSSKTGVVNQIQFLSLPLLSSSIDPLRLFRTNTTRLVPFPAKSLGCIDTKDQAVMCLDISINGQCLFLCTAEGAECKEYFVSFVSEIDQKNFGDLDCFISELGMAGDGIGIHNQSSMSSRRSSVSRKRSRTESFTCSVEPALFSHVELFTSSQLSACNSCISSPVLKSAPKFDEMLLMTKPGLNSAQNNTGNNSSLPASINSVCYGGYGMQLLIAGANKDDGSKGRVRVLQRAGLTAANNISSIVDLPYEPVLDIDASVASSSSSGCQEVERMCISPDSRLLCTICEAPDNRVARVWHLTQSDEQQLAVLGLPVQPQQPQIEYRVRHCQFSRLPGGLSSFSSSTSTSSRSDEDSCLLYLTHLPVSLRAKRAANYLSVWRLGGNGGCGVGGDGGLSSTTRAADVGSSNPNPTAAVTTGRAGGDFKTPRLCCVVDLPADQKPACLAISSDGRHIAVGTLEGDLIVWRFHDYRMNKVYVDVKAHRCFVTDLTFLPSSRCSLNGTDWELVTISTDSRIKWHAQILQPARKFSWVALGKWMLCWLLLVELVQLLNIFSQSAD